MGFLYKEVIAKKRVSVKKGMIFIVLFTLAAYIAVNSIAYSTKYNVDLGFILLADAAVVASALRIAYDLAYLSRIHCTYKLIDNELIFEKMVGNSRKMALSVDIRNIEAMGEFSEGKEYRDVERTYKFLCHPCKSRIYSCIVKRDGKRTRFYFQPSEELVNRLKSAINRSLK